MRPVSPPEFSRTVRIDDLPPLGRAIAAAATRGERAALALLFGLAGLARLEMEGELTAIRGGTVIRLAARLSADVTQTCVVTLVPLERRIEADFVRLYAAEVSSEGARGEEVFFDEEAEDIEPIIGNRIDAGEAAAEQLALELDPYPRAAEASLQPASELFSSDREGGEDEESRPFARLAERGLRKRSK